MAGICDLHLTSVGYQSMNQGLRGWPMPQAPAVPYVNVQDQKTSGTNGGTFTTGADRTRDLNTIDSDDAGVATLAANQLTLPAGTWRFDILCPAFEVDAHQALLFNVTDAVTVKRGTSARSGAGDSTATTSRISGKMKLWGSKVLEVRHVCSTTKSASGFGPGGGLGTEVYTVAEFWKEG